MHISHFSYRIMLSCCITLSLCLHMLTECLILCIQTNPELAKSIAVNICNNYNYLKNDCD